MRFYKERAPLSFQILRKLNPCNLDNWKDAEVSGRGQLQVGFVNWWEGLGWRKGLEQCLLSGIPQPPTLVQINRSGRLSLVQVVVPSFSCVVPDLLVRVEEGSPAALRPDKRVDSQLSSVQLLSHVRLFATPWTAACQASLSLTNSQSLLKLMSIESVMPSTISSSVALFSSCPPSFPESGSFPMS